MPHATKYPGSICTYQRSAAADYPRDVYASVGRTLKFPSMVCAGCGCSCLRELGDRYSRVLFEQAPINHVQRPHRMYSSLMMCILFVSQPTVRSLAPSCTTSLLAVFATFCYCTSIGAGVSAHSCMSARSRRRPVSRTFQAAAGE